MHGWDHAGRMGQGLVGGVAFGAGPTTLPIHCGPLSHFAAETAPAWVTYDLFIVAFTYLIK